MQRGNIYTISISILTKLEHPERITGKSRYIKLLLWFFKFSSETSGKHLDKLIVASGFIV